MVEVGHLDASTLQEVLADVAAVVFDRVLVDELFAHDWSLLLETRHFSFLRHTQTHRTATNEHRHCLNIKKK